MRDVESVEIGTPQGRGLRSRGRHEFVSSDWNGGNPQIFESQRIVQTARGAGASIRQGFDHGIGSAKLIDDL